MFAFVAVVDQMELAGMTVQVERLQQTIKLERQKLYVIELIARELLIELGEPPSEPQLRDIIRVCQGDLPRTTLGKKAWEIAMRTR